MSTSSLAVGSHAITAVYGGDANFITSTSTPAVAQVVNKAATDDELDRRTEPFLAGAVGDLHRDRFRYFTRAPVRPRAA